MHLVRLQPAALPRVSTIRLRSKLLPQRLGTQFDLILVNAEIQRSASFARPRNRAGDDVPLVLELVPQVKHLDLDLARAIVRQDLFVGLTLSVLDGVQVLGVGGYCVARSEV